MPRTINPAGIALLKEFEGCRLDVYKDQKGILTIGYGHTGDVTEGENISQEAAEILLKKDLLIREIAVDAHTPESLNSNQFSALVCFAYNVGISNFIGSHLLIKIHLGLFDQVPAEWGRWVHENGVPDPGLIRRRQAELDLFNCPQLG